MFDQIEKGRGLLLGTKLGAIVLGVLCFPAVFFLSLIVTVPFAEWYWAEGGQGALPALGLSLWIGIAGSIVACIVFLRKAWRTEG